MSELILRSFFPGDYERVTTLLRNEDMLSPERDSLARLEAVAKTPNSILVLAMGGIAIGSVYVGDGNGIPIIQGLVVDPSCRRRGYGEMLMRAAEDEVRARGYESAEVLVDDHKTGLMAWYQKLGYAKEYACVGMVKDLSQPETQVEREIAASLTDSFEHLYWHQRSLVSPGQAYLLEGVDVMNELLASSPIEFLRDIHIPTGDFKDFTTLSASPWLPYGHRPDKARYKRRWLGLAEEPAAVGVRLLRIDDWALGDSRRYGPTLSPYGFYVGHDIQAGIIVPFEIHDQGAIIPVDPDVQIDLLMSLLDSTEFFNRKPDQPRVMYRA